MSRKGEAKTTGCDGRGTIGAMKRSRQMMFVAVTLVVIVAVFVGIFGNNIRAVFGASSNALSAPAGSGRPAGRAPSAAPPPPCENPPC